MRIRVLSLALILALLMVTSAEAGQTKKKSADKTVPPKSQVSKVDRAPSAANSNQPPSSMQSATSTVDAERAPTPRFRVVNMNMTQVVRSANYRLGKRAICPLVYDGVSPQFKALAVGGEPVTGGGKSDSYAVAEGFFPDYTTGGCCGQFTGGQSGNTDCSEDGKRNLADITRLIDRVYISKVELCCEENGNIDGDLDGKLNLSDITRLIDHVYISKAETMPCN